MTVDPVIGSPGPLVDHPPTSGGGFGHVARLSVVFALGSIAGKAISLVMLPILTRILSPADYGRLDVLYTLGSALITALLLGLDTAAVRLYFMDRTAPDRRQLVTAWFLLAAAIVAVPAVALAALAPQLSRWLFGDAPLAAAFVWLAIVVIAGTYHYACLTILRIQARPWTYSALSAGTLVLNAVLTLALVGMFSSGPTAVIAAYAVSLTIAAAMGIGLVRRDLGRRPARTDVSGLLRMGLPLAPAVGLMWAGEFLNRTILLGSSGADQVAFLSVALRFASVAGLAVVGFQMAWQPRMFALGVNEMALRTAGTEARAICAVIMLGTGLLALVGPELLQILSGSAYGGAIPVLGFALMGVIASGFVLVATMPSMLAGRLRDVGVATGAGVVVTTVLTIALAPIAGGVGAGIAIAIGQLVTALLAWWLGSRGLRMSVEWAAIFVGFVVVGVVCLGATTIGAESIPLRLGLLLVLVGWAVVDGTALRALRAFDPRGGGPARA